MNQKKTTPSARIVDLTPELAEELLSRNPHNRRRVQRNYESLKRAITRGEWVVNGEAIKIDTNGLMSDGQHRCMAVVETGITIQTFLIEGLPPTTRYTMDTGAARSLKAFLEMNNEVNTTTLASVVRILAQHDNFGLRAALHNSNQLTNMEYLSWLDENGWVRDILGMTWKIGNASALTGAVAALLWKAFDDIDSEDAEFFFERLIDGAGLEQGHPILVLRQTFDGLERQKHTKPRDRSYYAALTIKAWNAYREGRSISQLKFNPGGARPEKFPEPV